MTTTKKHYAARDFTDAGTERAFTVGSPVDVDAGTIANYVAAGLVTDKAPEAAKSA